MNFIITREYGDYLIGATSEIDYFNKLSRVQLFIAFDIEDKLSSYIWIKVKSKKDECN